MGSYRALLKNLEREGYVKTPRIVGAFYAIDRKDFVPEEFREEAYVDAPLAIGRGQTISQPLTVAFMLELLQPMPGDFALDIGAGSGWTTALLAHVVSGRGRNHASGIKNNKKGRVVAVERIPELAEFGKRNVSRYNFIKKGVVKFLCGNATDEATLAHQGIAAYDKILSGAAAYKEIPDIWKKYLRIGGRIVAPIDDYIIMIDKDIDGRYREERFYGFRFVPLVKDER